MRRWPLAALVLLAVTGSGCYNLVIDAVVDEEGPQPGGTFKIELGGEASREVAALAQGEPLTITGQNDSLVVSMTCGDDFNGRSAATILSAPGGQITVTITPGARTQLQVHAGGKSCLATAGEVQLAAGRDATLAGTISATGHLSGSDTACAMSGTLTAIPLVK